MGRKMDFSLIGLGLGHTVLLLGLDQSPQATGTRNKGEVLQGGRMLASYQNLQMSVTRLFPGWSHSGLGHFSKYVNELLV